MYAIFIETGLLIIIGKGKGHPRTDHESPEGE
jgi:hypothetical protein